MSEQQEKWRDLQGKINAAVEAWRREHPEATLTEIEEVVDGQVAALRRQIVEDLAQGGRTAELTGLREEERPCCPRCGRRAGAPGGRDVGAEPPEATAYPQQLLLSAAGAYLEAQSHGIVLALDDGEVCRCWQGYYGPEKPGKLPFGVGDGIVGLLPLPTFPERGAVSEEESSGVSEADAALWRAVLEELALQMTQATFTAWLADSCLIERKGIQFMVEVRNEEVRDWVSHRLASRFDERCGMWQGWRMYCLASLWNPDERHPILVILSTRSVQDRQTHIFACQRTTIFKKYRSYRPEFKREALALLSWVNT